MNTIITMHELYGLTNQELGGLQQLLASLLENADPASQEHRNISVSLENIVRARGHKNTPKTHIS